MCVGGSKGWGRHVETDSKKVADATTASRANAGLTLVRAGNEEEGAGDAECGTANTDVIGMGGMLCYSGSADGT